MSDRMQCPKCGSECERDEADIGIGTIGGPWGCPACHWIEGEEMRAVAKPPPKLRVYLAGPSSELDRVFAAMNAITAAGHEITEHWWARIDEAARNGWTHDAVVPGEYMHESARRNREGILDADVVIASFCAVTFADAFMEPTCSDFMGGRR